jgi:hypothetical protein
MILIQVGKYSVCGWGALAEENITRSSARALVVSAGAVVNHDKENSPFWFSLNVPEGDGCCPRRADLRMWSNPNMRKRPG